MKKRILFKQGKMKTLLTTIALLLFCSMLNAQQWYMLNSPTGNNLKAVHFVSQSTEWVGGSNGTIMKTTDAGASWTMQTLPTTSSVLDIHFTSSQTGILCCGNGKIFKTLNGGDDWTEKDSGGSYALIGMQFRDATNGYAVGGPTFGTPVIRRTSDGGETWSSMGVPYNQLRTVHFFSGSRGIVAGADSYIYKTDNGGDDWDKVFRSTTGTINQFFYANSNIGYAVAGLGVLIKTTDRDTNFLEIPIPGLPEYTSANSLHFISNNEGWMALDNGLIAHITTGGSGIQVQNTGTTNDLNDIFFINAAHGFAVGDGGVVLSTNPTSEINNITLVGQIDNTLSKGPFYVVGDKAYVSMNNGDSYVYSINVFDISNPASPALLGSIDFPCCIFGVYAVGNYVYVSGPENKLIIVDVSDPANPVEKGSHGIISLERLVVSGNYAYVTSDGNEVWVVDISNADAPAYTGNYSSPSVAKDVAVSGEMLYVACANKSLRVVDVSNPANPSETGSYNTPGPALGVYTSGNYAYVSAMQEGLRIIDVSDPGNPFESGSVTGIGQTVRISGSGNYVYITAANVVTMIDVSDASQPQVVGNYETESGSSGKIDDVLGIGKYIFVADSYEGFYILQNDLISGADELSAPDSPNFTIYPNPAGSVVSLQSAVFSLQSATVALYDLNGRRILEKQIPAGTESFEFDVSHLQSGVYFCKLNTEKYSVTKKLLIQK